MKKISLTLIFLLFASCSSLKDKTIIAHRGASGYLPEHTLAGVVMAHSWGVDYIEPDVVMTKDNHLVVLHDIHLDTTTNVKEVYPSKARRDGRFYAIDLTLKQVKKLKVHERISLKTKKAKYAKRFNSAFNYFQVPTFTEFINLVKELNRVRGTKIGIYVEFKSPEFHLKNKKDITKTLVQSLSKLKLPSSSTPLIVQSFYPSSLKRIKNEFKLDVPLVQLIAHNSWAESSVNYEKMMTPEGIKEIASYASGIGPWLPLLLENPRSKNIKPSKILESIKSHKLFNHPFTARTDDLPPFVKSYEQLLDLAFNKMKVDGIFADQADKALEYIKR